MVETQKVESWLSSSNFAEFTGKDRLHNIEGTFWNQLLSGQKIVWGIHFTDIVNSENLIHEVTPVKEFIGCVLLKELNWIHRNAELDLAIKASRWNEGVGKQVVSWVLEHAFDKLGLHKVISRCTVNNKAVQKIENYVHATCEGRLRENFYNNGTWEDQLIYGLTKEVWEKNRYEDR